jgi:hypothetical protein
LKISLEAQVFHDISANMHRVMRELKEQNERDQPALRSVSEDVGRCLALLAMSAPQGAFLRAGQQRWLLQPVAVARRSGARGEVDDGRAR